MTDVYTAQSSRISTRTLAVVAMLLVAVLLASVLASFLLLRQPRLEPVPVPSVSQL